MFLRLRKTLILACGIVLAATFFISNTQAEEKNDDNFKITDCGQLVNLGNEKMFCWFETKDLKYNGRIYNKGKFYIPEDGVYNSVGFTHSFRVENGSVFIKKAGVSLEGVNAKAYFYQTDLDGGLGQKVYFCDLAKLKVNSSGEYDSCSVAPDGTHKTKTGVSFTTKDGFLGHACS